MSKSLEIRVIPCSCPVRRRLRILSALTFLLCNLAIIVGSNYYWFGLGDKTTDKTAQVLFYDSDGAEESFNYEDITELGSEDLIDSVLASGTKSGYIFEAEAGATGDHYFFTNQSGTIIFPDEATSTDNQSNLKASSVPSKK